MISFLPPTRREIDALPAIAQPLLDLAPLQLPNWRKVRYLGDDVFVVLDKLVLRDQTLLRELYEALTELLYAIADPSSSDEQKWEAVAQWTRQRNLDAVIGDVRELGRASHEQNPSEELAKSMHDVRGGALAALLGRLQMIKLLPRNEGSLNTLFILTRDHLKIMRSAVVGLDEPRREADHKPKSHGVRLILEKWHNSVVGPKWHERQIQMFVDCRHEGALTECCLESAAIDRIFYNLANNACRHVADDRLDMAIFPVPDATGETLRFVLSNQVSEEDAVYLRGLMPEGADSVDKGSGQSIFSLFEPEVSSTGSGFGLTVVAQFAAYAFGLRDRQDALRKRYVGAVLEGHTFRIWFHWPVANSGLPQKLDDFHQPQQSLSEA